MTLEERINQAKDDYGITIMELCSFGAEPAVSGQICTSDPESRVAAEKALEQALRHRGVA